MSIELEGFTRTSFTHDGVTKDVYRRGSGPGIVVISEIPGITPQVIQFAERLVAEGYTVFMPQLFGTPGKPLSLPHALGVMARTCISREFAVLASNQSSPVTDWLRALCRHVHKELGGKGVGAIGMCLTGNFALSLMVDPAVVAPVLSQPSLPLPIGRERRAGMHISESDLAVVKERCAGGAKVLGLRFTNDGTCPPERFQSLRSALGEGFEGIEIDSSPGNPPWHLAQGALGGDERPRRQGGSPHAQGARPGALVLPRAIEGLSAALRAQTWPRSSPSTRRPRAGARRPRRARPTRRARNARRTARGARYGRPAGWRGASPASSRRAAGPAPHRRHARRRAGVKGR